MNTGSVLEKLLSETLSRLCDAHNYLVAYSGGLDSHVLLHSLIKLRDDMPDLHIRAVHVNHGLHPDAAVWAARCERVCNEYQVPFILDTVSVDVSNGDSIEAAARTARYQVFAKRLQRAECLLTAHTQDDQAETVLLQLLRGAGPKGLSAMPEKKFFAHSVHLRPLLTATRETLQAYAKSYDLSWVEDASNQDSRFDRNYLRQNVMPLLKQRWPAALQNLARSAKHAASATEALVDIAEFDLEDLSGARENTLSVSALLRLTNVRRANVLRYWLQCKDERAPSTQQLAQLEQDILCCDANASPVFVLEHHTLRRYRDDVYLIPNTRTKLNFEYHWDCQSVLKLPGNFGELDPEVFSGYNQLTIRFRREGESLKKTFQQRGVPPWERDRVPLVFHGDRLIAVID